RRPQGGSPHGPQLSHRPRWRPHQRRARRCRLQLQPAPALVRGAFTRPLVGPLPRPLGRPASPNPVPQNFLHGRLVTKLAHKLPLRRDGEPMTTPKRSHLQAIAEKVAILVAKLLVTGACFWYVARQIDLNQVLSAIPLLDFRWAAFAILVATLEIPLSGLRWYNIVRWRGGGDLGGFRAAIIAATAVGVFFAQVLPSVAGDGVRAWLLVRLGSSWHNAVTSAVIDRGVGVGLMIALGFVVLLL